LIYVGIELTKRHEQHYRDSVNKIRTYLEELNEGNRMKGEITMIISPYKDADQLETEQLFKS
jgi:16S rRNA C1402 (ribose-2'-O) methylase RsmI